LHAHADAVHAEAAQQFRFARCHGGGIHFDGELFRVGEIQVALQSGEEPFELRDGERGGCSAPDEHGARRAAIAEKLRLANDGLDERVGFSRSGEIFVEAAVGTDLQAEGDVEVEVLCTCDE